MPAPATAPVNAPDTASHRWDIQALRGLAVGGVLLQHAAPGVLPGGYLGVDLFFVVSGFLITGQVLQGLREGRFSLAGFYARRARRLLPAAYAVLAATLLASPWWLVLIPLLVPPLVLFSFRSLAGLGPVASSMRAL